MAADFSTSAGSYEELPQVVVEGAELAAVIAGGDAEDPALAAGAGGADAARHRVPHHRVSEAVDDDFQHRVDLRRQRGLGDALKGRAVGVVGGGDEPLVLRSHLGA